MVVGGNANVDMPYTQEAAMKMFGIKIRAFIKLVDYLILDSKLKLVSNATKKL